MTQNIQIPVRVDFDELAANFSRARNSAGFGGRGLVVAGS